ncbi:phosphotransferase [Nonomuraea phyllanthi]|uniref:phosphotransferase family protein n=1 Tax=Nonomuraea phyllanthi TaxID=2219224 RepID=UPI00129306B1|nr:phosphotransferase [Nonomuraea phyllanthi]QFY07284.1 phosphotransferase [Nonomuraea phyllanthi]
MGGHAIEVRSDVVVKRYRSSGHDEPGREWRALGLLDAYAPGLAPAPVSADLEADPPVVVMSRLGGEAVRGKIAGRLVDALAEAVTRVQHGIPRRALEQVPPRAGHPVELLEQVRGWAAPAAPLDGDPTIAEALRAASAWVARPGLERVLARPGTPVFGTGDGNLANYLWDGTRVRVVDFEYSGRSDRAFELAEIGEHIAVWENDRHGMTAVLERLELTAEETARLTECRRLMAMYWLLRTKGEVRSEQAVRMLALL